jgi:hypothetical protein
VALIDAGELFDIKKSENFYLSSDSVKKSTAKESSHPDFINQEEAEEVEVL